MRKVSGISVSSDTFLLAAAVDRLSLLVWAQTKDAEKGTNRPRSIVAMLLPEQRSVDAFDSGEDFEKARHDIINRCAKGGE